LLILFPVFLGLNSTKELAHEEYLVTARSHFYATYYFTHNCCTISHWLSM